MAPPSGLNHQIWVGAVELVYQVPQVILTKIGEKMMRNTDLICRAISCYLNLHSTKSAVPKFHCSPKQGAKHFCKWVHEESSIWFSFQGPELTMSLFCLNSDSLVLTNLWSGAVKVFPRQTQGTLSSLTSSHSLTCSLCFSQSKSLYIP